jgi:YjbE family integral membrane protein
MSRAGSDPLRPSRERWQWSCTLDSTSLQYVFSIFQIALINVALSGDNAVVIALAAHHLPARQRRRVVLWGGSLAVAMQAGFTLVISRLLRIPGLRIIGAVLLLGIAGKLAQEEVGGEVAVGTGEESAATGTGASVARIALANLAMSFDNVLAIASVCRSDPVRMGLGLAISGLILFAFSAGISSLMARFRWVAYAGALMLAITAAGMIWREVASESGVFAARVTDLATPPVRSGPEPLPG